MLSTGALRAHILAARLAGSVATSREASLRSYRLFAARDPRATLGLLPERDWSERELIALMADRCGVSDDPSCVDGPDVIDPERTLTALAAFAERLGAVAARGGAVLLGTGHPHRLLGFYAGLADALSAAGCVVLTPAQGRCVDITTRFGVRTYNLEYVRGVAMVREAGARGAASETGAHSHSPCRFGSPWRVSRRAKGPCRTSSWVTTAGSAGQVSWGLTRSGSPTPTIRRSSWGRPRGRCPWSFRLMTLCGPITTYR